MMSTYIDENSKHIIVKVRSYFEKEKNSGIDSININQVVKRTADCLGISEKTVKRVSAEHQATGIVSAPKKKSGRPKIEIDEFLQGVLRRTVMDFYVDRKFPTVKEVYTKFKEDINEIEFSQTTLYRWLKQLGFSYKKFNNKPILMEQNSVAAKRAEFLMDIKRYRDRQWQVFYTDETWCGANHSRKFGWVEKVNPEKLTNFDEYRGSVQQINGYRGGIKKPSGSGQRVIILHIGNDNGFLEGALKCFVGNKKKASTDYHHEMNKQHFEEWFRFVLTVLPNKSVIVIDQAPYHTMLDPNFKNPTTAWRKATIIEWMSKKQVILPDDVEKFEELTKARLLEMCKPYHFQKVYLLDTITKEIRGDDIKLLWLPVAHCEFNAIELIWAYLKNKVAKLNTTFKITDVLNLCEETMREMPISVWENSVKHAKKIEDIYRHNDVIVETVIEPLIIDLNDESSGEDDYDEEGALDNDIINDDSSESD